ncbi:hypothetical protein IAT40_001523 [Kwoniella sp. CBS 6097]
MNNRFKRPSSSQVTPSSIARETDTSRRTKFRSLPPSQSAQRPRHQEPLFLPSRSDISSQTSSVTGYGQPPNSVAPMGFTIGRVAREEAEKESGGRPETNRLERMMYAPSAAGDGQDNQVQGEEKETGGDCLPKMQSRILAFHAPSAGSLAASWYDPEERKIAVLEDTKDTLTWDLAILMLEQVQPDLILMSSRTQLSLIDQVTRWEEQNRPSESSEADSTKTTRVTILRQNACTIALAHSHLATIRLPDRSIPVFSHEGEDNVSRDSSTRYEVEYREEGAGMGYHRLSLVKLACWFNVDAPLAVISVGILVAEVKKELANCLSGAGVNVSGLELTGLGSINLDQHMQINKDALTSLAIFDTEAHAFMYSDVQKQALSVYGLLNKAVTPLGKKLMHTWHLRPLLDLGEIAARHDAVSLFSSPEIMPVTHGLRKELKKMKNLANVLSRLRDGSAKYNEWNGLRQSLQALIDIEKSTRKISLHQPIDVVEKVDWKESYSQGRMMIRSGVDGDLDRWRDEYAGLTGVLIDADEPPEIPGWSKKFRIEDKMYYKSGETRELDEHYGDIANLIRGREVEIMQVLTEKIHAQEPLILAATEVVTELDCLLALAVAADQLDLHRPIMTEDKILRIKNGRHLLYERMTERYISNNTLLQGGREGRYHSMMVVTGANGSGKSAYGKQVALITFMAQIGSFVPATDATIGICDKKSSSRHGSAFMIDLGQVSQALRGATDRSLIILDEFGKGTISWDGAGLLAGVVEYLLSTCCPRTIVATHFHELFTQNFLTEDQQVQFAHMKCLMAQDTKELHFFYKLDPQPCLTSYAAECALHHGVPKDIVDRARFVTECMNKFEFHKLHDASITTEQGKEIDEAEEIAKRFFQWEVDEESEDVQEVLREMLESVDLKGTKSDTSGEKSEDGTESGIGSDDDEGSGNPPRGHQGGIEIEGTRVTPNDETD